MEFVVLFWKLEMLLLTTEYGSIVFFSVVLALRRFLLGLNHRHWVLGSPNLLLYIGFVCFFKSQIPFFFSFGGIKHKMYFICEVTEKLFITEWWWELNQSLGEGGIGKSMGPWSDTLHMSVALLNYWMNNKVLMWW